MHIRYSFKKSMNNPKTVFFIGGILASLFFLYLYGTSVLNPTYDGWLYNGTNRSDLILHYYGWRFYRKSEWCFPLGMIDGITYPNKLSIIYTDSIPIFALFFKILSPLLPDTFQYIGIFGLVSFFLLGGFSSLCIYSITMDSCYSLVTSLLFDSSIIFLMRVFYHSALSAQWLIVASIHIFINKELKWSTRKSVCAWGILSVLAISIQAYFYPMVFGILFCSQINYLIRNKVSKKTLTRIIMVIFGSVLLCLFSGWILGFWDSSVSGAGNGLGMFSFNYNSFFNTFGYTRLFNPLPALSFWQYEGYCYLGLGLYLILIFSSLFFIFNNKKSRIIIKRISWVKMIPVLVYVICFTAFAAGPLFSFGSICIDYNLPSAIIKLWSYFRSTGRFIWPVAYLFMLFICCFTYQVFNNKRLAYILVCFAVCVQLIENYPYFVSVKDHYKVTDYKYISTLKDPLWECVAEECEHIVFYPDTSKFYTDYYCQSQAQELMIFAEKNDMTTNTNFICRDTSTVVNTDVYKLFEENDSLDDKTVYVFIDEIPKNANELYYYYLDDILIGLKHPL